MKRTAEEIKMRVGSAYPLDEELTMEVKGRDSVAGLPKTIHVTSQENPRGARRHDRRDRRRRARDARTLPARTFRRPRRSRLRDGWRRRAHPRQSTSCSRKKTGLPVTVSDDPLSAVANGTGAVLNDLSWLMQNV